MVNITKWLIYGLVGAFALSSLIDPARAQGTVKAFGGIGSALGNLGTGAQGFLTGIGTGAAQLFNPLWTLRDLIYGPQAGVQVQKDMYEITSTGNTQNTQQAIQQQENVQQQFQSTGFFPTQTSPQQQIGMTPAYSLQGATEGAAQAANTTMQGFHYQMDPRVSPVPVTKVRVHGTNLPISADAVQYYQSIGVQVSPANTETVAANNAQNATSPLEQAHAAGYSLGSSSSSSNNNASTGGFGTGGNTSTGNTSSNNNASTGGFGAAN